MKERPILFSAPMVQALLDGSKTQTRRIIKGGDKWPASAVRATLLESRGTAMAVDVKRCTYGPEIKIPYGQPGDRLWVRETWLKTNPWGDHHTYGYRASDAAEFPDAVWKPSIHMPRVASRINLEVTGVRVERLQDISEADAIAEGAEWGACGAPQEGSYKAGYAQLWESINDPGSWDANPWVWVVEFKKVTS